MGRLAYDLGNTHLEPGVLAPNGSVRFWIIQETPDQVVARVGLTEGGLQKSLFYVDKVISTLTEAQINQARLEKTGRDYSSFL